ncbi:hypothetical protein BURMUCGD2M_0697 [Burkholderia multivorans CGD2M]|uniref:Uncharacterized protein n=1 Tax=Burkholderia multivorans CGD2 TaxID=513052 RepID=B9BU59_9BURK|nr:hypothetical protein BURMUCGD2_0607 [Burkholderia multivorans CGD2]EEE12601.1 hypothetical protein BURMUCGD2M_0697 [Burkholderia multivorans CGD2M]
MRHRAGRPPARVAGAYQFRELVLFWSRFLRPKRVVRAPGMRAQADRSG